ncbi:hypothetical protein OPQ81_010538 [Rhizoctonia solani]|nr:hypothetical protein OPQ81_010538 [Rhizoctonia solani]
MHKRSARPNVASYPYTSPTISPRSTSLKVLDSKSLLATFIIMSSVCTSNPTSDSGNNNILPPPGFPSDPDENFLLLRDTGWLCGFRVDNIDGPQLSTLRVASHIDGVTPSVRAMNKVISETITTYSQREANYVHHGWSVGAVAVVSPWTISRVDATNRQNAGGTWVTRRTLAQRLGVRVLLEDLTPVPEFKKAIEEALARPTIFEKLRAVYCALDRWGDVVPLEIEMGTSLAMTDSEKNFNNFPSIDAYNSFTYLSTIKTASVAKSGGAGCLGWEDGSWIVKDVPAPEWQPIRIVSVTTTISLLPSSLQAQLTDLYAKRLTYVPPPYIRSNRTISKVEIHGANFIDGISVNYLDGVISRGGGNGGNHHVFMLTNEHITEVLTCNDGNWLRGIQLITNQGRCSPIYGQLSGIPIILRSKGGILAGLLISAKKHPEWNYLVSGIRGIWRHDVVPRVPKENDVYSDYYGSKMESSKDFNDRALIGNSNSIYISNVEVRAGADIDSIQIKDSLLEYESFGKSLSQDSPHLAWRSRSSSTVVPKSIHLTRGLWSGDCGGPRARTLATGSSATESIYILFLGVCCWGRSCIVTLQQSGRAYTKDYQLCFQ